MNEADQRAYVERYEERLRRHGHSPLTLGWGDHPGREAVRFGVIAAVLDEVGGGSLLDVGCGFADLHDFLRDRGWHGTYAGIDLVPGLLEVARERHPGLDLRLGDLAELDATSGPAFDVVAASGVFNARLSGEDNLAHIEAGVQRMFALARRAVVVDFMSTYVDFQHPDAWHTDPAWALALGRRLSKRVLLRHDYMPFEFALVVLRDDEHPGNVFRPHGGAA